MIETERSRAEWLKSRGLEPNPPDYKKASHQLNIEAGQLEQRKPKFDKVAYQRNYMRQKRAADKLKKARVQP